MADESERIAREVLTERARQDAKWGEQNHPDGTGPRKNDAIIDLGEIYHTRGVDLAEIAKINTDVAATEGRVTWAHILLEEVFEALAESNPETLRVELIQVAAVAQQWAQAIDRRLMDEVHASRASRR